MMSERAGYIVQEEKWDHRDVVRIIFDDPARPVNVLTPFVIRSLKETLADLDSHPPSAVIVESDKPDVFIAGADIREIAGLSDIDAARELAREGRDILWKLHTIRCPTYAAIDGVALGGGLELALFCDYRIVTDHPRTRLGLPEVTLGIIPGFGGTQSLPRLIGLGPALDLILTGRQIDGRRAEKLNLADRCVPRALLSEYLRAFVVSHPKKSHWPAMPPPFFLVREIMCAAAKRRVIRKTLGHYPAPLAAIDAVRRGLGQPLSDGLSIETDLFAPLPATAQCRNLMRTYFQTEKYKKFTVKRLETLQRDRALELKRRAPKCAVLGAGTMGAGIALHLASSGCPVRLKDVEPAFLQKGLKAASKVVMGAQKKRRISREEARDIMNRIQPTLGVEAISGVDVVIEAVLEDETLKRRVFDEVTRAVGRETILATNTSSLPIERISDGRDRQERGRYVGLHFFNPVDKMPLVEVVVSEQTSDETLAFAIEFVKRIKKTPVVVKDRAGFLVNRVLMPYLNEAALLLASGERIDHIDRVAVSFGMPMGPLHLVDVVGLDVAEKVGEVLFRAFGDRMSPCPLFERMRKEGRLGQKNGKGFYIYDGDRRYPDERLYEGLPDPPRETDEEIMDRLILAMVNESSRILEEGVVDDAETVDIGMLLGTGFPPFRGGLLHYADQRGLPRIVERLREFARRVGPRFTPSDHLVRLAAEGRQFHLNQT